QGVALPSPSVPVRAPLLHRSREEGHRGGTASSSRNPRVTEGETEGICGSEESEDARVDGDTCANTSRPPLRLGSASAVQGACLPPPGGELSGSLSDTTADSSEPGSSCLLACVGPYLDGCSLVVNQADRTHPGLQEVCRTLGQRLFTHVFAVAYLTPPSSYAVGTHTDDQDVFLIQLWGQKHWKIYAPPQQLPLSEEMLGKKEPFSKDPGQPVLQVTLEEGDILYIPRGYV
ncbi:bifunctional lysine-specific demethylase and histidyl-hydroxylase NO66-like, partial [Physeter macrocephalus]|uniref:Bifunctional lysine-specific demethylase and histidyl-hydroxylase n=1 Tax=Physeter macrocephalus TaxID=9755 RepID=A0A455B3T7_PHYMC